MDIVGIVEFLLNQCNSLHYGDKKIITLKNTSLITKKVKNILQMDKCFIYIKSENKVILYKKVISYSIFEPNSEILKIISSKQDIPIKLEKIENIIKHYEIDKSTAKKLKNFLNKLSKIVNKKLKEKIEKIKKEIKTKSIAYV